MKTNKSTSHNQEKDYTMEKSGHNQNKSDQQPSSYKNVKTAYDHAKNQAKKTSGNKSGMHNYGNQGKEHSSSDENESKDYEKNCDEDCKPKR